MTWKKFGELLSSIRKKRQLSPLNVATILGVSVVMVRNWESGTLSPSKTYLEKLAELYKLKPQYLLGMLHPPRDHSKKIAPSISELFRGKVVLASGYRTPRRPGPSSALD